MSESKLEQEILTGIDNTQTLIVGVCVERKSWRNYETIKALSRKCVYAYRNIASSFYNGFVSIENLYFITWLYFKG